MNCISEPLPPEHENDVIDIFNHNAEKTFYAYSERIPADISSGNGPSIKFYERNGFTRCGTFRNIGRKFNKNFDVVWMEKEPG